MLYFVQREKISFGLRSFCCVVRWCYCIEWHIMPSMTELMPPCGFFFAALFSSSVSRAHAAKELLVGGSELKHLCVFAAFSHQQLPATQSWSCQVFYVCPSCYPFLRGYWNFCQMFKNASVIYRILRELAWTLQERLSFPLYAVDAHGTFGYEDVFLLTSLFRTCNSRSQENKGLLLPTFLNLPLSTTFFSQFEWCGHASVIGWLKW